MHRRSYLAGASLGTLLLAGCAGAPTNSDTTADGSGLPDDDSASDDVLQLGDSFTDPRWASSGSTTDSAGYVARFDSRDELRWLVDARDGETPDAVTEFLDGTDFESAVILYVQSVGPNSCYHELAVDTIAVADDAITATATAVDTSDAETACAEVITYPSAFVRVTGEDLPAATRLTLTNGWGTTAELDAGAPLIDPDTLAGGVEPDGDPPAVPAALDCDTAGFERHPDYIDDDTVEYGTLTDDDGDPTFALRVRNPAGDADAGDTDDADADAGDTDAAVPDAAADLTFERGDEIEFRLVNVSNHTLTTGNEHKYSLQLQTENGWEEVRGTTGDADRLLYTDIGFGQPPGEGFTWSFDLTEAGLLAGHTHEDDLTICPDLQPGRYRFAYWGVPDGPLAVQFDYTD